MHNKCRVAPFTLLSCIARSKANKCLKSNLWGHLYGYASLLSTMWPSELSIVLQSAVKRAKSASTPGSHRSLRHSKQNRYVVNPDHLHLRKAPATQCVSMEIEVCLLHLLHLYFHLSFDLDHTDIGEMTKKGVRLYLQEGPVKIITVKEYTMLYYPHSQAIPMFILAKLLVLEIACSACASTPLITEHIKAVSEGCGSQALQVHSTCQSPATYIQSKQLSPHTPTP